MRNYYLIIILLIIANPFCSGQDTLREQHSMMSSVYFVIQDNTFEYHYGDCTSQYYGKGKLTRGLFFWKFKFDSIITPQSTYSLEKSGPLNDTIEICIRSSIDSSAISLRLFDINNRSYNYYFSNQKFSRAELPGDSLNIKVNNETIFVNQSLMNYNKLTLYLSQSGWLNYISGGTIKLRKHKNEFLLKTFVIHKSNKGKPIRNKLVKRYK